jgi:hypothetical protein
MPSVADLRTCIVSYSDMNATHRVEVPATSLYEAVVLAIKAMNISQEGLHLIRFRIEVKTPVVWHEISGSMLRAWLARNGTTPKERAMKERLSELLRA